MVSNDLRKSYMILDSRNVSLARARLESPAGAQTVQIQVLEDKAETVEAHEIVHLVSLGTDEPAAQCRIVRRRGDRFVLERLATLDPEFRRNLRVPVKFDSFIYPLTGAWQGRREICSIDLSCGGIAFYSDAFLEVGERMEVVIPMTDEPLVLHAQILKRQELRGEKIMYAAKFVDMCYDEEVMVRRAVFSIQLRNEPRRSEAES